MKKLISLCLTFILIAGTIGTVAYAETMPDLLFDLDIQVNGDSYTLKDASTSANNKAGKVNIIYGQGKTSDETLKPILGKNSYGTNYIQFGEVVNGKAVNTNRPVQIDLGTDRNTDGGTNDSYANKDGITFETWVNLKDIENYITAWSWKAFFSLTGKRSGSLHTDVKNPMQPTLDINPTVNPKSITIEMRTDITSNKYTSGVNEEFIGSYQGNTNQTKLASSSNIFDAMTGDKWAHMVFVRKWTPYEPAKEGTYTGKWNYDIYLNGKNVGSLEKDTEERVDYNNVSYANGWIDYDTILLGRGAIAATSGGTLKDDGIVVQMADFRLWDGALTEAQVTAAYEATRAGFMDVPDVTDGTIEALSKLGRDDVGETFEVEFTSAVKANTVVDGSIHIEDEFGNKVATEFVSYDEGTYTATLKLKDYFAYGREYKLCLPGVKDLAGSAVGRTEIPFTTAVKSGVEVISAVPTLTATTAKVDLEVKNTDEKPLTVGMFIMVYRDGKIQKLAMTKGEDIKTIAAGESATVTVTTDGLTDGDEIRSMAYSIVEGKGRIAFTSPIELTVE